MLQVLQLTISLHVKLEGKRPKKTEYMKQTKSTIPKPKNLIQNNLLSAPQKSTQDHTQITTSKPTWPTNSTLHPVGSFEFGDVDSGKQAQGIPPRPK